VPGLRCWLMTGDLDEYTAADLELLGAVGVFYKPFVLAEVARALGA